MTPLLAVALMSTFYGVIIANLIMLPLSSKLKEKSILFESSLVMIIEALTAISQREHPLKIEEKLAGVRGLKEMEAIPLGSNVRWGGIKIGV
jgi:chemotaxis protein MotA